MMRAQEAKSATRQRRKEIFQQEIADIITSHIEPSIQNAIHRGEYSATIGVQKYTKLQRSLIQEHFEKLNYVCIFNNNWLIIDWSC